jgi:hypothetical protein
MFFSFHNPMKNVISLKVRNLDSNFLLILPTLRFQYFVELRGDGVIIRNAKNRKLYLYYICLAGRNQVYTAKIINRVAGLQEKNGANI